MAKPTPEALAEMLEQTLLFRGLPKATVDRVIGELEVTRHEPGEAICTQGDEADALFIISQGQCTVFHEDKQLSVEREVTQLKPPDPFGEIGLVLGERRNATVRAATDVVCLRLSRNSFGMLLMDEPQLGVKISQNLARRLTEQTQNLTHKYVELNDHVFDPELYRILPQDLLIKHSVVPLELKDQHLLVALPHPEDPVAMDALHRAAPGLTLRPVACGVAAYRRYLEHVIRPAMQGRVIQQVRQRRAEAEDLKPRDLQIHRARMLMDESAKEITGDGVTRLLKEIFTEAIVRGASDIHIEPADQCRVRFRIHGRLQKFVHAPYTFHLPLVSQLKVAANLDIVQKRKPQDGRISVSNGGRSFDVRISTLPTIDGEKVVMRMLETSGGLLPLDALILSGDLVSRLRQAIMGTMGCVLVVGPTGSGKTTTLYSALAELSKASPDINISTIEDPVEYTLPNIVQTPINKSVGMDFPQVLRALLRQDPDVILVGEMRDATTAQIAMEGALTGHLVLSTLHANGAPEAVTRLVEIGCARYLVASAISMVIGQRLLRRICRRCKTAHTFSDNVREHLARADIMPMDDSASLWRGRGCDECSGSGFQGRVGAYEVLQIDPRMREAIMNESLSDQLRARGVEDGTLTTFKQYGAFLLRMGYTEPTEILRNFAT